jgi:hypothetical protein
LAKRHIQIADTSTTSASVSYCATRPLLIHDKSQCSAHLRHSPGAVHPFTVKRCNVSFTIDGNQAAATASAGSFSITTAHRLRADLNRRNPSARRYHRPPACE